MKMAFTLWNNRISPLFDAARHLVLVEDDQQTEVALPDAVGAKVLQLRLEQVDVLVCGAISRRVQHLVEAEGIRLIPFVSGEWEDVMQAIQEHRLEQLSFSMPGCRCCRRHRQHRNYGEVENER